VFRINVTCEHLASVRRRIAVRGGAESTESDNISGIFDHHDKWALWLHRGTKSAQRMLDSKRLEERRIHDPNVRGAPGIDMYSRERLQIRSSGVATLLVERHGWTTAAPDEYSAIARS